MQIGLVTDSSCDLPAAVVEQYGMEVVPAILVLEDRQYADGVDLSRQEFYARLPALHSAPTTAAPSIGEFRLRYERLLESGCEHVLSVHASAKLTAISAVARQAAADFDGRVTVVDSHSLSLGLGFQVLAAAQAAELGRQAVLDAIESTRRRIRVLAALDTLTYAHRGGRISAVVARFGTLLHIKPIVEVTDGDVKPVAAMRTTRQANERLAAMLHSGGRLESLAVLHSGAESRGREFLAHIMQQSSALLPRDILLVNVTPAIGVHVGPHALGFAAVLAAT